MKLETYTKKKFWPSKFVNDPQIFKQGVINDPQKSGLAETLYISCKAEKYCIEEPVSLYILYRGISV